jgi:signal transduction histidine kinase
VNNLSKEPAKLKSVPITFLGVMALLVFALSWLGWLLLEQDQSLKEQRSRVRVETAGVELESAIANGIDLMREKLNKIADELNSLNTADLYTLGDPLQVHEIYIHFSADGMTVNPKTALRYIPITGEPESLPLEFEQADRLEFQQQDYPAALQLLKPLSESPQDHIRAEALMRLGRIDRRNGHLNEALSSYQRLVRLSGQKIGSAPADWFGLYARCSIYESENDLQGLRSELERLKQALSGGGAAVSRVTYRYYVDAVDQWSENFTRDDNHQVTEQSHAPSDMALDFFNVWNDWLLGNSAVFGIRTTGTLQEKLLGTWTTFETGLLGIIIGFDDFAGYYLAGTTENLEHRGIGWQISDATGQSLLSSGPVPRSNPPSLRSFAIGDNTLTVTTYAMPTVVPDPADTNRRRLLLSGLFLVLLIILSSTYFISRSLRREAEISRLQSDFVAAVSHEFRTPLTSIRQLTELLASGRVADSEKAQAYYRILGSESARLQRLVEGLLDFGRMEAGAHRYRPESLDCGELLESIVTSFREEYDLTAADISLEINGRLHVRMDKEALTRAIWNLMDNAVKYSPEKVKIEISAQMDNDKVSISVSDQGVGISTDEQSEIFNKFVRGSAANLTNAKGTGLGLAMVRKIIEDQGGAITARNNVNGGSVFTMTLVSMD